MKAIFYHFLILLSPLCANGQHKAISNIELQQLYIQTLNNDLSLELSGGPMYFQLNPIIEGVQDESTLSWVIFLSDEELIKKALKRKTSLTTFRIGHKYISSDTIDINIGIANLTAKRKFLFSTQANYQLQCGGTNGYSPNTRYVRDGESWVKSEFVKPKSYRDSLKKGL